MHDSPTFEEKNLNIIILTPMEIEKEKVLAAIARLGSSKHHYQIIVSGIGRESTAKTMLRMPPHDLCILMGFAAVVGVEVDLPAHLGLGMPIEITNSSLYGYEGGLFENGKPIAAEPKLQLACLSSLTSDKFVRTTDLSVGTVVNMEDYTFMYLKNPQDCIVRIVSDFLPHTKEIDFFEEVAPICFDKALEAVENWV